MKEVLFKGKTDKGEWVYGDFIENQGSCYIYTASDTTTIPIPSNEQIISVICNKIIPETVGQFTGLYDDTPWEELTTEEQIWFLLPENGGTRSKEDWKGRPIFEGDIVIVTDDDGDVEFCNGGVGNVVIESGMWYVAGNPQNSLYDLSRCYYLKVIGNIHDNPVYLEKE